MLGGIARTGLARATGSSFILTEAIVQCLEYWEPRAGGLLQPPGACISQMPWVLADHYVTPKFCPSSLLSSNLSSEMQRENRIPFLQIFFFLLSFSADLLLASHPLDRERKKTHSFLEVSHLTMCVFNSQHSSILIWSITLSSEGRQATEHLLASPR